MATNLQSGMTVCAKYDNGWYYPGTIKKVNQTGGTAIVTWEEDNTESIVKLTDCRPQFDPLPVAVIESRWDDRCGFLDTVSVKLFFELLGALYKGNPGAFHYEMFSSKAALEEILPRIGNDRRFRYAYIACHGDSRGLYGHGQNQNPISRDDLREFLANSSELVGLHFATCSFGTIKLAEFLFQSNLPLKWISGYRKNVDWAESSPIDMMFLHLILKNHSRSMKPIPKIKMIARDMHRLMSGACKKTGFSIYVPGESGAVVDLISDQSV